MNLKGRVHMCTEVQYEAVIRDGEVEKGMELGWARSYFFNENGFKTEEILAHKDGSDASKAIYSYDRGGKRLEVNTFHPDGKPKQVIRSKYNRNGFELERAVEDSNGTGDNWNTSYEYDRDGKITEEIIVRNGGKPTKIFYAYDDAGFLVQTKQVEPDGRVSVLRVFKYDENGNKKEMQEVLNGITKENHTYTYVIDRYGNWIRQTDKVEGKAVVITEREIKYFYPAVFSN